MARMIGPEPGSRMAYTLRGDNTIGTAAGLPAVFYADEAGTTAPDILTYPGGAAIPGGSTAVQDTSLLPLIQYPDGVDVVYVSVNGGPISPVYARTGDRIGAALQGYLLKTGGTITGNLGVQAAPGGKNYNLRTDGSNLDLEGAGADLFLSVWSDAAKAVTQRNYARYEAGAQLAHLLGRYVIAGSAFSGTFTLDVDPVAGTAKTGSKNGYAGIPWAAMKLTAGAPTTDTWALFDHVSATDGIYRCTAAGTPGTWVKLA